MKQTIYLLVNILTYMEDCEKKNSRCKTTLNEIISALETIFSSANRCKKLALKLKLIRELKGRGEHMQKFYRITPLGKQFLEISKQDGIYTAIRFAKQNANKS